MITNDRQKTRPTSVVAVALLVLAAWLVLTGGETGVSVADGAAVTAVKRAGESEAAYQARLRAAARNRTLNRGGAGPVLDIPNVKFKLRKRSGESEAAYQARLRAVARNFGLREVILTENGAGGRFKVFSTARDNGGAPLAHSCFQFELSRGLFRASFQGSEAAFPGPTRYRSLWAYICGAGETVLYLNESPGTAWRQSGDLGPRSMSYVAGVESITVGALDYEGCVKIVTGITGARFDQAEATGAVEGQGTLWFAPGVGLVKIVYKSVDGKQAQAELIDSHVVDQSATYMPLAIGNEWTYRWSSERDGSDRVETLRIAGPGDRVHMYAPRNLTSGPGPGWIEMD